MNEVVVKTGNENVQGGQTGITLFWEQCKR